MNRRVQPISLLRSVTLLLTTSLLVACGGAVPVPVTGNSNTGTSSKPAKLVLAAYTTPREAYQEIIPIFQKAWKEKTGQDVAFEESYQGSGTQSRAVVEGFQADVVALSLEADIARIQEAGLITRDWQKQSNNGIVSTSVVAFAVRSGNPKGIKDWADLAKPGIDILTPNPKTSGGAMWNILALYGAVKRGMVAGVPANDDTAARQFLSSVLRNVSVMDKGARESMISFEKGIGDVAITYENEVRVGQQNGENYELVIPASTILIQNPVAIVDKYVDQHGSREVAQAFLDFLFTPQAQEIFAKHGLRSPNPEIAKTTANEYPEVKDLFTIDFFGGWAQATPVFFGDNGIYYQTISQIQGASQ